MSRGWAVFQKLELRSLNIFKISIPTYQETFTLMLLS